MSTLSIYLLTFLASFILGGIVMIIINKLTKIPKKEQPIFDEEMVSQLIIAYPDRKDLEKLYFNYQVILTLAGLGVASLVQTLSNIWFDAWVGCVLFGFIFIYVSIIAFLTKRKIIREYDRYINKANKLLKLI
jgi:hypothetical protein